MTGRHAYLVAVHVCEEQWFLESRKDTVQMDKEITAESGDCATLP